MTLGKGNPCSKNLLKEPYLPPKQVQMRICARSTPANLVRYLGKIPVFQVVRYVRISFAARSDHDVTLIVSDLSVIGRCGATAATVQALQCVWCGSTISICAAWWSGRYGCSVSSVWNLDAATQSCLFTISGGISIK